jgi:hypothetical protein
MIFPRTRSSREYLRKEIQWSIPRFFIGGRERRRGK